LNPVISFGEVFGLCHSRGLDGVTDFSKSHKEMVLMLQAFEAQCLCTRIFFVNKTQKSTNFDKRVCRPEEDAVQPFGQATPP